MLSFITEITDLCTMLLCNRVGGLVVFLGTFLSVFRLELKIGVWLKSILIVFQKTGCASVANVAINGSHRITLFFSTQTARLAEIWCAGLQLLLLVILNLVPPPIYTKLSKSILIAIKLQFLIYLQRIFPRTALKPSSVLSGTSTECSAFKWRLQWSTRKQVIVSYPIS